MREFIDSREGYVEEDWNEYEAWLEEQEASGYEDDGQPSEYTEWQDLYGGDDWDHGQYDSDF